MLKNWLRNPNAERIAEILMWIAVIIVILALAACADPPPEQGVVRERKFTSQWTHMHDGGTMCVSYGSNGLCNVSVPLPDDPHEHCVGGCYEFYLENCEVDEGGDRDCDPGWRQVTEGEYDRYRIGQHYPNPA